MLNYGDRFKMIQDESYEFPDFTLEYLGETLTDPKPGIHISPITKHYKVSSSKGGQTLPWGTGTGLKSPLRFRVGASTFSFEPWEETTVISKE